MAEEVNQADGVEAEPWALPVFRLIADKIQHKEKHDP